MKAIVLGMALAGLLTACVEGREPYVQTDASRAAFAFADRLLAGERGDLPAKAREAGLVNLGVCQDAGGGALYCNALQLSDVRFIGGQPHGSQLNFQYDELRVCLRPSEAFGFIGTNHAGDLLVRHLEYYPNEFTSLRRYSNVKVLTQPQFRDGGGFELTSVIGGQSQRDVLRRMGYPIAPGSFRLMSMTLKYRMSDFPPHDIALNSC